MKKTLGFLVVLAFATLFVGCWATQGGGQIDPIASLFIPKTLYDYGPTLLADAAQVCNVGAAKEYNANQVVCLNPTAFIAQIPVTINASQLSAAVGAICTINGYGSGQPATATVGNCTAAHPMI